MSNADNLERFVVAQESDYPAALREITNGRKQTHWMWYVFPQLDGLGSSAMARRYSIKSLDEARAYLAHPLLGQRLLACAHAVLSHHGQSATSIFGHPDGLKLHSSATLFAFVSEPGSPFHQLLDAFFSSQPDSATLRLLDF